MRGIVLGTTKVSLEGNVGGKSIISDITKKIIRFSAYVSNWLLFVAEYTTIEILGNK